MTIISRNSNIEAENSFTRLHDCVGDHLMQKAMFKVRKTRVSVLLLSSTHLMCILGINFQVLIEGFSLAVRCILTMLLIVYYPKWGLISFSIAQVMFSLLSPASHLSIQLYWFIRLIHYYCTFSDIVSLPATEFVFYTYCIQYTPQISHILRCLM